MPQVESIGERWFREFFGGIAKYIREFTCADADERILAAYFQLAIKLGGHLRIADLLNDDGTRQVLRECFTPLIVESADKTLAQPLSDVVTAHIAMIRGVAGADPVKITAAEMQHFLSFLRPEIRIELGLSALTDEELEHLVA